MKQQHYVPLVLLTLALVATAASAENPIYLTAKVGTTSSDARLGESFTKILDGDDESAAVGIGFRLGNHLAFQAEYQDLGKLPGTGSPCPQGSDACVAVVVPVEADSTAVTVTLLPQVRLTERLSLYGKAGFVSWSSDVSEIRDTGSRFIEDFDDEAFVYGAGLRLLFPGPFGAYAEYERLSDAFDAVSLGATFGF